MNAPDRVERATAHAAEVEAISTYPRPVERVSDDSAQPLYAVCTKKTSGAWVTFDEFRCPRIANEVAAILKSFGAAVRVELIEQPIR